MPRINKATPKEKARAAFEGVLREGMLKQRLTHEELAKRMEINPTTWRSRRKDPDTFTVGELKKLSRITGESYSRYIDALGR